MKVTPEPGDRPEEVLRQLAEEFDRDAKGSDEIVADVPLTDAAHKLWTRKAEGERAWARRLRARATRVENKR